MRPLLTLYATDISAGAVSTPTTGISAGAGLSLPLLGQRSKDPEVWRLTLFSGVLSCVLTGGMPSAAKLTGVVRMVTGVIRSGAKGSHWLRLVRRQSEGR